MNLYFEFDRTGLETQINTDKPFNENLIPETRGYSVATLSVNTTEDKGVDENEGDFVANVKFTIFDNEYFENSGTSMIDIADMHDGDVYNALIRLFEKNHPDEMSTIYDCQHEYLGNQEKINEGKTFTPLCTVYVSRLFVNEKFRGQGVASYIFDNLSEMIFEYYKMYPHCVMIYVEPDDKSENQYEEMKKTMIHTIKKSKFKHLENNWYMRNYGADPIVD